MKLAGAVIQTDDIVLVNEIEQLIFQPNPNFFGTAIFEYVINNQEQTNPFLIIVQSINDAPSLLAEKNLVAKEDIPFPIFDEDTYLQDYEYSDVEGDSWFNLKLFSIPEVGRLELNGTELTVDSPLSADQLGDLVYISANNWNSNKSAVGETVSFKFIVNDNSINGQNEDGSSSNPFSTPTTVNISVVPVNDAPAIQDSSVSTSEDLAYTFNIAAFNTGYQDQEGDSFANIKIEGLPQNATLNLLQPDNNIQVVIVNQVIDSTQIDQLQLTPDNNWHGSTSFSFSVNDDSINSQNEDGSSFNPFSTPATVNVSVVPINDAPLFDLSTTALTVDEDFTEIQTVTLIPKVVPTDEMGQIVNYVLTPASIDLATVIFDQAQLEITISAISNGNGSQLLTITATETQPDGSGLVNNTAQQTMMLTVNPVNDPHTVQGETVKIQEDQIYSFQENDFKNNYQDIEQKALANIKIISLPTVESGQLKLSNGQDQWTNISEVDVIPIGDISQLAFEPVVNWNGTVTFLFSVNDTEGGDDFYSQPVVLTMVVDPVNDPPTVSDHNIEILEDQSHQFTALDFQQS